eukprot:CAMPEP_0119564892 /NCGR_PEP_ID=MMETSP1352-20130426/28313_1 /TAXON_ID=265584 /ORGANISM="Stauroneis constricta, Strain CCMP1120" /LENGTH=160 /DNA_ID=CAMNT_0007613701 /DNA_START=24 /DNA_END=503 /DNA_ORIENTATION=+
MSSNNSIASNGNSTTSAPPLNFCPTCRTTIENEWHQIEIAKKRLQLQQDQIELDQELLRNKRKNQRINNKLRTKTSSDFQDSLLKQFHEKEESYKLTIETLKNEFQGAQTSLTATQKSLAQLFVERDQWKVSSESLKTTITELQSTYESAQASHLEEKQK